MDGERRRGRARTFLLGGLARCVGGGRGTRSSATDPAPARPPTGARRVRERALLPRVPRPRERPGGTGLPQVSTLAFAGADLRIPLPQRAHVRGLPEDERRARGGMRRLRGRAGREAALPRRRALQGLRASTRRTTAAAAASRRRTATAAVTSRRPTSRTRAAETRAAATRRSRPPTPASAAAYSRPRTGRPSAARAARCGR